MNLTQQKQALTEAYEVTVKANHGLDRKYEIYGYEGLVGVVIEKSKKYSRQNSRSVWYEVEGVDSKRYTNLYDAVESGLLAIEV